jgi:hypothetical protein
MLVTEHYLFAFPRSSRDKHDARVSCATKGAFVIDHYLGLSQVFFPLRSVINFVPVALLRCFKPHLGQNTRGWEMTAMPSDGFPRLALPQFFNFFLVLNRHIHERDYG